jgi:hypothetical protein
MVEPKHNLSVPILCFMACALAADVCSALDLVNSGVRWRVGGERVLGREQPEAFREWDLWASSRLPWQNYGPSGWGAGTRLLTSAGAMKGAESTALVVSALPVLALGTCDGRFTFDLGAGGALLSQHKFAQQDFGGPLQFALTFGFAAPVYRRIGIGYRFVHYSDAGAYGAFTIGADFHTIELIYRF